MNIQYTTSNADFFFTKQTENFDSRIEWIIRAIKVWRMRARSRADLKHLNSDQLNDIGISRSEAIYEASKPFWRA